MPLSEYEQRVLEQMERQLRSDDPKLASTLHGHRSNPVRIWLIGAVGALVGLGMLIGGVASGLPWLGWVGFAAMFGAVLLVLSAPRKRAPQEGAGTAGPAPKKKASLLSRFEERWERRRDQR